MVPEDARRSGFLERVGALLAGGGPAEVPNGWERAIRLGCQALVQAPRELRSVRLDGIPDHDVPGGTRILHFMDSAEAIAREYGLQARVDYHGGCPGVTLVRA
jgi:hypothetical protein